VVVGTDGESETLQFEAAQEGNATQQFEPVTITNLIPLRGDRAALELFVPVDDCSSCKMNRLTYAGDVNGVQRSAGWKR
jgi:hypothetical protein